MFLSTDVSQYLYSSLFLFPNPYFPSYLSFPVLTFSGTKVCTQVPISQNLYFQVLMSPQYFCFLLPMFTGTSMFLVT